MRQNENNFKLLMQNSPSGLRLVMVGAIYFCFFANKEMVNNKAAAVKF